MLQQADFFVGAVRTKCALEAAKERVLLHVAFERARFGGLVRAL